MKLDDKLNLEAGNTSVIFLHKEKDNWLAYERSAFLLTREIDYPFEPRLRQYHDNEIAVISFPSTCLPAFLENTAHAHIDDNFIAISSLHPFDRPLWTQWRHSLTGLEIGFGG